MKKSLLVLGLMFAVALPAGAQEGVDPVPYPPELPPQVQSGEVLEPEVTITETDKGTVQQYSIEGHVYMVKVIPAAGPAYYLVDTDGDGEMDSREDDPTNVSVPQWVLISW
jgi:hypothetical protein